MEYNFVPVDPNLVSFGLVTRVTGDAIPLTITQSNNTGTNKILGIDEKIFIGIIFGVVLMQALGEFL